MKWPVTRMADGAAVVLFHDGQGWQKRVSRDEQSTWLPEELTDADRERIATDPPKPIDDGLPDTHSVNEAEPDPPTWLIELASRIRGFENAIDVKWIHHDLKYQAAYSSEIAALCDCQKVNFTSVDRDPGAKVTYIHMRQVEGSWPSTWLGRCKACEAVHWYHR